MKFRQRENKQGKIRQMEIQPVKIRQKEIKSNAIKFFIEKEGVEIGRAYLFLISNALHEQPYGLLEDVFVQEEFRVQSLGTKLVKAVIEVAKERCYKLIGTSRYSRPKVHAWYEELGFKKYGVEFRMDFQ